MKSNIINALMIITLVAIFAHGIYTIITKSLD